MKAGDAEYDLLVERLLREGSFKTKAGEIFDYSISADDKSVTIQGTDKGTVKSYRNGGSIDNVPAHLQPKKRGRPVGSKNKPKAGKKRP